MRGGEYRFVINGIEHWCRIAGAVHGREPLVILHGGPGGNNYVFERTIGPRLEAFTTVVYYDQRGCGRSAVPADPLAYSIALLVDDLDRLREVLGLSRIVPLGYSFGADLAIEYAIAHGDRVSRLILQAPSGGDPDGSATLQLAGFARVAEGPMRSRIEDLIAEAGAPEQKVDRVWAEVDSATVDRFLFEDQEVAARNRALWRESGLSSTGAMQRALRRSDPGSPPLRERLRPLSLPTLVLVGRHDRNVGLSGARRVADAIPGAFLHVFERSAHFPDMEEPEAYAAAVRSFLQR